MKVVIDIPKEYYEFLKMFDDEKCSLNMLLIKKGTPLPKGHGDLKDVGALKTSYGLECATKYGNKSKEQQAHSYDTMMMYEIADMLDCAPTIIKADKEAKDEGCD